MNRLIRLSLVICLLNFFWMPVHSVPAYPGEISYKQPDGTIVKYRLKGDEHRHWMETPEGYLLKRADNGFIMYAEQDGKSIKASSLPYHGNDTAAKSKMRLLRHNDLGTAELTVGDPTLSTGSTFPTTGKRKLLMLLVNFADTEPVIPASEFEQMMNAENYEGTGSFRDFFLQNSYGQLDIETTVVGWIQLPSNKYMYSTEDMTRLISDALNAIGDDIDFTQFDNNGDGVLDGLSIIHQGTGAEVTGSSSDIWSHSGGLLSEIYAGGIRVNTYTIQPELLGISSPTQKMTVGVFCHEFGHNLGAPDFYDSDYEQSGGEFEGTGVWDLMAGGIWNESLQPGDSPSHINMWQKMQFGWVTPQYLTESQTVTDIPSASSSPVGYIAQTSREGDYFVLENRTQEGFDRALPGHGLVVYHVDEQRLRSNVNINSINVDSKQSVYTVCASAGTEPGTTPASYGDINSAGAPFPGEAGITEFSDATLPSTHSNDGKYSYFSLNDIRSDGTTASFEFVKGEAPATVRNLTVTAQRGIVSLRWDAPESGDVDTYRIFRDEELIAETKDMEYVDRGLTSTVATYKVDVRYNNGLYSPFATSMVRVPENKIASVSSLTDGQDVTLTWKLNTMLTRMNPDLASASENAAITVLNGSELEVAQQFRASDLRAYTGYTINEISFFPFTAQSEVSYKLRVYRAVESGEPEVISERDASEYGSGTWRTLKLRTPVTIEPGYDYYIGFAAESRIGSVAVVCDATTSDPGLGNLVRIDGTWHSDMLDSNIFLRCELQPRTYDTGDFLPGEEPVFNPTFDPISDVTYPLGFNVYRDNELIGFTSSGIFIDHGVSAGSHTYGIACLYEGNNESRISETTVTTTTTAINGPAGSEAATVCANGHSIIVKSSSDCVVSVYSVSGEAITTPAYVKAGTEASFTVKSAGLYIVKTETSEKTSTDKIIIK